MSDTKETSPGDPPETAEGLDLIREVFLGKQRFKEVGSPMVTPSSQNCLVALFFRAWGRAAHCFVVDPGYAGFVKPTLLLSLAGDRWQVQPFTITEPDISRSLGIPLHDQWVRILLDLVAEELNPLLPDGPQHLEHDLMEEEVFEIRPAMQRVEMYITGGYCAFLADKRMHRKWFIASRWPVWMAEGYSQDRAAAEVAEEEGMKVYSSDNLRKMLTEMGLVWLKSRTRRR